MKSIKQLQKEIDELTEKQETQNALIQLKKMKRRRNVNIFVQFWNSKIEDCDYDLDLNKKETELLRRFLYAMKKRSTTA